MSVSNFLPAMTFIQLYTQENSPNLILYKGKENYLKIKCIVSGITRRTIPYIHEDLDYIAIHFTLFHQFGGKETTIVRRFLIEYDPEQDEMIPDVENIELKIPIDDDFSNIDFVSNYYFLHVSFSSKHPDEMGISESIYSGRFFETKIPFSVYEG